MYRGKEQLRTMVNLRNRHLISRNGELGEQDILASAKPERELS